MLEHVDTLRRKNPRLVISVELEIRVPWKWAQKLVTYADVVFVSKDFAREQGSFKDFNKENCGFTDWDNMERAVKGVQEELSASKKTVICPWAEKVNSVESTYSAATSVTHRPS